MEHWNDGRWNPGMMGTMLHPAFHDSDIPIFHHFTPVLCYMVFSPYAFVKKKMEKGQSVTVCLTRTKGIRSENVQPQKPPGPAEVSHRQPPTDNE
jgi:hypothetical protein